MDSDFSANEPESRELAKPREDSPDLDALSYPQLDNLDDAGDADNPRIENQLDVSDAKADVDFDVPESAHDDSPFLGGHSLESSAASSPINSPVDPVGMFPAGVSHSESKAESSVEMERQRHSGLQPSPPKSVSPHGIEQTTDHRAIDEWTFAIDGSMSSNPAAETPATFAPDAIIGTTSQSLTSTPGDISRAEIGSRFSESAETVSSSAAQPAGDSVPLSQSKSNVEPAAMFVDTNGDATSALLQHNWDRGIPLPEDQSPDTATSFRMPPLLLEVSRTDYQNRIDKIEEAGAAHLNRIIGERIEAAMDERDFMRAAEIRALLR